MSTYRLLIADDEMIERKVLYKTLSENLGDQCAIFQAENGREALRIYEEEAIQIAILDIEMPGINGIEAAEKIREKDRDCCIIFLTAFDEFSYARKAITVRALDYVLKPYDEQELMLVVEEAIRITSERLNGGNGPERAGGGPVGAAVPAGETPFNGGMTSAGEAPFTGGMTSAGEAPFTGGMTSAGEAPFTGGVALAGGCGGQDEPEDFGSVRLSKVAEIIDRYIHENYMFDISMQDLARSMNYSEAYFCKLFKQCFNKNFTSYLTEFRVEEAKKMLEKPTVNVKEVGKAVGYADSNYFAKVFKRITGQSPTEYRLVIFQRM